DYFQKFSEFLLQLQPLALSISRQREANSTALHAAVNTSFTALPGFDELKPAPVETYLTR
ncbi:hypothetical protein, partial [Pseudomonas gingeri]|uniref:hypothetical protein n=1 Tax=Pseudomonas gingeri TaxID=117681 RepID=UPI001CA4C35D